MKQITVVTALCAAGILVWLFGSRLSSDALGMAIGLLFGLLAGVPTLLLVLSSQKRQARREYDDDGDDYARPVYITYNVTSNADNRQLTVNTDAATMPLLADRQREVQARQSGRVFKVVGERAEWTPREPLPPLPPEQRFNWYGKDSEWGDDE